MKYASELTPREIEILNAHPAIKSASNTRVSFTFEFRTLVWEALDGNFTPGALREYLRTTDIPWELIPSKTLDNLLTTFKRTGKPAGGKNKVFRKCAATFKATPERAEVLLATGRFTVSGRGVSFTQAFKDELFANYPDVSIEEGLQMAGIDPELVGYQLIRSLRLEFDDYKNSSDKNTGLRSALHSSEIVEKYRNHPLVDYFSEYKCKFSDAFWDLAADLSSFHVNDILSVCGFDPCDFSIAQRNSIKYKLRALDPKPSSQQQKDLPGDIQFQIGFLSRKAALLEKRVNGTFEQVRTALPGLTCPQKKKVCQWIETLPTGKGEWSRRGILKKCGISKSSYHSILSNDDYGKSREADPEDQRIVKEVFGRYGFKKGYRQVWMQIKHDYPDHYIGRNKVRKLMKQMGLNAGIRENKAPSKGQKRHIEENLKPNLLNRQFRLAPPMTHILTDVTYIDYGDKEKAYKSSVKDAVTGRTLASVISDSNDARLAMDTLEALEQYTFAPGAVFHSDQGILYFSEDFQKKVKELGLTQSMSRRGVCFDNSSQESYFGHYKDEVDYQTCQSLEELKALDSEYEHYYNHIRRMESRKGMTPVEYEEYMSSLNCDEYKQYMDNEIFKYEQMKERSAQAMIHAANMARAQREDYNDEHEDEISCRGYRY